jgi:hypothetical protein
MSEYPCTGLDKAALKIALQERKKSQIVSVRNAIFFRHLLGKFCLFHAQTTLLRGFQAPF